MKWPRKIANFTINFVLPVSSIILTLKNLFFSENFRHPHFIVLECYNYIYLNLKFQGKIWQKSEMRAKWIFAPKKSQFSIYFTNISNFGGFFIIVFSVFKVFTPTEWKPSVLDACRVYKKEKITGILTLGVKVVRHSILNLRLILLKRL